MALLRRNKAKSKGRGSGGMSPAKAGIIAIIVIAVATFWGFTRFNPFKSPYELKATFHTANNIQPKSPVRIAGVNVGVGKEGKAARRRQGRERDDGDRGQGPPDPQGRAAED